ncbi:OmpA family protein [Marinoscillum pacificum]|uniref:OmpA family protein n=1 Tax=Marinoscillum pacificum TaxID=392723 RepID=UPI002157185F|nr:OmpA family protein [Marinoscillum pacificum]
MNLKLLLNGFLATVLLFIYVESSAQDSTSTQRKGVDIFITQSPKIIISLDNTVDNKCYGDSKGAINITPKGGFPPYKYYWSHGATTQDVADLAAGFYKVAVYDGYSCSDTLTVEVKQPEPLKGEVMNTKDILCYGYNQGMIDIEVSGGVAPYTYSWSNGATTQDLQDVKSGEYSVLITDANNCQDIVVARIEEKPLIVRSFDDLSNIKCFGDETGKIDISIEGGIPPYTFLWSNGATTEDISGLKAGNYEVTVTDAAGCTEVYAAKVKQPDQLTLNIDEVRNVRCYGDEGGAINIGVLGGTPPYSYEWSNGMTTQDINGVKAGRYSVTVIDAYGCSGSMETEITQPENMVVEMVSSSNVSHYGGTDGAIDIRVSGGVAPYKFRWNNDETTEDISNLPAGNYNAKVTDATGCSKFIQVAIEQPEQLTAVINRAVNINCFGDESGELAVAIRGGIRPYTILWNTGATTSEITGLKAGAYSVTIEDANNHSVQIDTVLTEPDEFIAEVKQVTNILCFGEKEGAVDVEVVGGVPPYKYYWSNGMITQDIIDVPAGSYSVKILDANRCVQNLEVEITQPEDLGIAMESLENVKCFDEATGSINVTVTGGVEPYDFTWSNGATTQNIADLKAGNYKLTVQDANGCVEEFSTRITQPELLVIREEQVGHIDCFGNTNGYIHLNISGGAAPYTYAWNNGATTKNVNDLAAGSYNVTVTDANGCQATYAQEIKTPEELVATIDETVDNVCAGDLKGEINISVVGGVAPYRYRWSTGATSQDLVNVKSGKYSVQITDANGCIDTLSAEIKEPPVLEVKIESTNILCYGSKSGAINLTVTGGTKPYSFEWSNGAKTEDVSALGAGEYSVIIKDASGCSRIEDVMITEPARFVAILESETQIKCYGQNTGAIRVRVSGGVEPYTYKWSNGATSKDILDIPAGTYDLLATDANGCTQSIKSTITQPTVVEYSINSVTDLTCFGDNGGAIDISVIGGIGPYDYLWSNGATTQDLVNVPAGKYTVQIKEGNGCMNTLEAEIKQPELLMLKLDTVVNINCYGDNTGSVGISVKGGVPPYKYSWSNGATTEDISNLTAGNYSVTVTDAHGCVKSASTVVKEPNPFVATIIDQQNVMCNGDATGSIKLNVTGGVQPYTFKWNNGATAQNLSNLTAGKYSVLITDAMGCTQSIETEITQPPVMKVELVAVEDVSCSGGYNGSINISVTGGKTPYRYKWSNGATSQDLENIPAGTYKLYVMDAYGCSDENIEVTVAEPEPITASITSVTNINSYGLSTGAIDLSISGGVQPYKYSWSNGSTTQDISQIPAGNYSVFIVDANECEVYLNATVTQPPQLNVLVESVQNILCSGNSTGAIRVSVSGGVQPYTFEWSNGDSTQNITDVPAGDYSLTVTDANNHRKIITSNISEPTNLNVNVDHIEHVKIFGQKTGAVDITVTGGVRPYTYQWNNGSSSQDLKEMAAGRYELLLTDANGCTVNTIAQIEEPQELVASISDVTNVFCNGDNKGAIRVSVSGGVTPYQFRWSNGERTQDIEDVIAGVYTLKITDANGSVKNLEAEIKQPSSLNASITSQIHNDCYGEQQGSIAVSVSGGVPPYSYSWSNGATANSIESLAAGDYDVIIRDSVGCEQRLMATIEQPEELVAKVESIRNITCNGEAEGKIEVDVTGGTSPYRFKWNNGSETRNLNQVLAGEYSLEVYDANDCYVKLDAEITEPTLLTVQLDTIVHNLCKDDKQGMVEISVSGGVTPYEYRWSNGERSEDLVDVIADTYTVIVKDANGCTQELTAEVLEPQLLSIVVDSISHVPCSGDETGYFSVQAAGGVAPYKFSWSNGATGNVLQNVKAGKYEATVTDANGCSATISDFINEPPALISGISAITDIQCYGDSSGAIYITALEGVGPYEFEWSNGATTKDITGLMAGDYQLKITQGNGCVTFLEATVNQPEPFELEVVSVDDVTCFGDQTGKIDIEVSGGVAPYTYSWSNGAETQDIAGVKADNYSVMVRDANGCLLTTSLDINQPKELLLTIDSVRNVKCCGDTSGAIFISVTGGVAPYKYNWSNGATTQDITNLPLGKYTVTVTDAVGCEVSTIEADDLDIYEQVLTKGKFVTNAIQFDVAKATIRPESFSIVNKIATIMKEYPQLTFRIEGHTDADGTEASNLDLSKRRAAAIKEALVKFGISENRLQTEGYGESRPIATNLTQEGKQLNRRVEFISLTGNLSGEFENLEQEE